MIRIISWNINSVRLRIGRVTELVADLKPDILCLQETKCPDEAFPIKAFEKMGLPHLNIKGQKAGHGVVTASKHPLKILAPPDFCREGHARVCASHIAGYDIHNLYVPAGGDEPDPDINDKFAHKLDFLSRMRKTYKTAAKSKTPLIVVGDLNVAPHENDVWSHKQLLKVVSHTPVETDELNAIIDEGAFCDAARAAHDDDQKLYSWWSYRAKDWAKSNRGRRLDHIWVNKIGTPSAKLDSYKIHIAYRGGEKPSDHAPISLDLKEV